MVGRLDLKLIGAVFKGGGGEELAELVGFGGPDWLTIFIPDLDDGVFHDGTAFIQNHANHGIGSEGAAGEGEVGGGSGGDGGGCGRAGARQGRTGWRLGFGLRLLRRWRGKGAGVRWRLVRFWLGLNVNGGGGGHGVG